MPTEEFRCEGCNAVIDKYQYEKVKKVLGKGMCPDCARKESAESMDAAMTPRDKVFAWLARNNFEEQKTVKGFFILDGTTKIAVDMNKPSDMFRGAPVIGRLEVNGDVIEEGHGIARIDDVRQTIIGLLKNKDAGNVKKERPAPKAELKQADVVNKQREVLPVLKEDTPLTLDNILEYINPMATKQEAFMFLQLCKARDLNPFIREAYLIKYKSDEPASMVVGKDAFYRKAHESGKLKGIESGIIVKDGEGKILEREGTFMYPKDDTGKGGDTLLGGWAKIYCKDMEKPVVVKVALSEYLRRNREGQPQKNWATMPATMICKVAKVQGLREAFTKELGGCYDAAELGEEVK